MPNLHFKDGTKGVIKSLHKLFKAAHRWDKYIYTQLYILGMR